MDNRPKIAQILVVPLLLLLVWLWWFQFRALSQKTRVPPAAGATVPIPMAPSPAAVQESSGASQPLTIPTRDPFRWPPILEDKLRTKDADAPEVPVVVKPPMPDLQLQGVFWGTTPPRAIVNRQILTEGDTIEGVKIVKIGREGVTVEYYGDRSTLRTPSVGSPQ